MQVGEIILNFLLITFLGLLIAFSPSLIIINFLLALKSKRPIRDALILIAGTILPLVVIACAAVIWLKPDSSFHFGSSLPDIKIPPLIEILFGLSLIGYALLRYFRKPTKAKKSSFATKAQNIITSPGSIFSFGLARSALSLTNLLAVLVVCKTLITSNAGPLVTFLGVAWALFIGIVPLLAAPFLYKYHPAVLDRYQSRIDRIINQNHAWLINIIFAIAGIIFVIHGALKVNGG